MPNATNSALIVELLTLVRLFVTQHMIKLTLCMLNHVACVGLKRNYFIICCRGATTTAFRRESCLKNGHAKKCGLLLFLFESLWFLSRFECLLIMLLMMMLIQMLLRMPFLVAVMKFCS